MTRYYKSKYRKTETKKQQRTGSMFNVRFLMLSMFLGMFILGFVYLWKTNNIAVKGYEMRDLEQNVAELKRENELLSIQATQLETLQHVQDKVGELGLVPVEKIEYISPTDSMVASK